MNDTIINEIYEEITWRRHRYL